MKALWTQSELRDAFAANPSERLDATVNGVSIDTRTLQAGDLFFAIRAIRTTAMTTSPAPSRWAQRRRSSPAVGRPRSLHSGQSMPPTTP